MANEWLSLDPGTINVLGFYVYKILIVRNGSKVAKYKPAGRFKKGRTASGLRGRFRTTDDLAGALGGCGVGAAQDDLEEYARELEFFNDGAAIGAEELEEMLPTDVLDVVRVTAAVFNKLAGASALEEVV